MGMLHHFGGVKSGFNRRKGLFMKKLIKYLVILSLVFTSLGVMVVFLWQAFEKKDVADSLYNAEKFFNEKKYPEAKQAIQEVLTRDNLNEKALRLSAEILEKEYNFPLAALLWKRLISLNPLDESLVYRYVAALNAARNFRETALYLEKRKKAGKLLAPEVLELARAEFEMGNFKEAERLFGDLDKGLVNQDDYSLLSADLRLVDNQPEEAKKTYEWLARQSDKTLVRFTALLRLSSFATGPAEREKILKEAAAVFPLFGNTVLADYYLSLGRFQDAVNLLEKVPNTERNFLQVRQLGEAYAALQKTEKLKTLIKLIPTNLRDGVVLKYYLEALSSFLGKKYEKTRELLENCPDFSDRPLFNYLQLESGVALNLPPAGLIGNARKLVESGEENAPKRIMAILLPLLQRYYDAKRYGDGIILGNYLISMEEKNPSAEELLLLCYLREGKLEPQFTEVTGRILARNPGDRNALLAATIQAVASNRPQEAKQLSLELLKADPKSMFALSLLAGFEEQAKNIPGAEKYLRQELDANPDEPEAADRLFVFLMRNKPASVDGFADQYAAGGTPARKARAYLYKAFSAIVSNQRQKAYGYFQEALKNDQKILTAYLNLAELSGTPEEKKKYLLEAQREFPGNKMVLLQLAALYATEKNDAEAAKLYENLLRQEPNNLLILINYAEVLASLGQQEKAMTLAVQAKTLYPKDPRVQECYAMREFEQNNYPQVILELETLLKQKQTNPRIVDTLVEALIAEGSRAGKDVLLAKRCFQRALELKPGDPKATEGLRKLAEEERK